MNSENKDSYVLRSALYSVQGDRACQEDRGFAAVEKEIYGIGIICDGIGGLSDGDRASDTAMRGFLKDFSEMDLKEEAYCDFFRREMRRLDDRIFVMKDETGRELSAGTTLCAVVIDEGMLSWVSVGDSKIYIIRDDMMVQCNREHNYRAVLDDMLKKGKISLEIYEQEIEKGDFLTSYLGMGDLSQIDANPHPLRLQRGDVVLLCSDGLSKILSQKQILSQVLNCRNYPGKIPEKLLEALKQEAMHRNMKQDNTTILVFFYEKQEMRESERGK